MGSTTSLAEESDHHPVSVQTIQNHVGHQLGSRMIGVKLPHQDTCESDGGVLEDIGRLRQDYFTIFVT